ncbi:MAG TPA: glycosyl hydrolase family 28-related protein [Clostridiales bacterium]|nr:glycosyl hydrolase family 28-related protein [Clostridiales bacterium]
MQTVNVKDFGAMSDGINDDFSAFQKALGAGERKVYIPAGRYRISKTLKVACNTEIIADDNAEIFVCEKLPKKRGDFLLTNAEHEKGNKNITIKGGVWSGNYDGKNNSKHPDIFEPTAASGALINFFNVENLKIEGVTLANPVTYFSRFSKIDGFVIRDVTFKSEVVTINHDGLHFGGECRNGVIENIRAATYGETGDDLLAFNADDCVTRLENRDILCGDIENITVKNVYAENCHTAVRFASVTSRIRNIHIENITAGCRAYAVNMDATRYCRTPVFKEEDFPKGVGRIENVTIENFEAWFSDSGKDHALICAETLCDGFKMSAFRRNLNKDKSPDAPTVRVRNVTDTEVVYSSDGKRERAVLRGKNEDLIIFKAPDELEINKAEQRL